MNTGVDTQDDRQSCEDACSHLEHSLVEGRLVETALGAEELLQRHGKLRLSHDKSLMARVMYVFLQAMFLVERSVSHWHALGNREFS